MVSNDSSQMPREKYNSLKPALIWPPSPFSPTEMRNAAAAADSRLRVRALWSHGPVIKKNYSLSKMLLSKQQQQQKQWKKKKKKRVEKWGEKPQQVLRWDINNR